MLYNDCSTVILWCTFEWSILWKDVSVTGIPLWLYLLELVWKQLEVITVLTFKCHVKSCYNWFHSGSKQESLSILSKQLFQKCCIIKSDHQDNKIFNLINLKWMIHHDKFAMTEMCSNLKLIACLWQQFCLSWNALN